MIVSLEGHVVEVERGRWCPACALPSISRYRIALVESASLLVLAHRSFDHCDECGVQVAAPDGATG